MIFILLVFNLFVVFLKFLHKQIDILALYQSLNAVPSIKISIMQKKAAPHTIKERLLC